MSRDAAFLDPDRREVSISAPARNISISRRTLTVGTTGIGLSLFAGGTIALIPRPAMAQAEWAALLLSGARALFDFLFRENSPLFSAISRWLNGTPIQAQSPPQDIHGQYSYQAAFLGRSDFNLVRPGVYAGVNRLPQFSVDVGGGDVNDLNWAEIDTTIRRQQPVVRAEVAGRELIRGYVGPRRPFIPARDQAVFNNIVTPAAASMQDRGALPRSELNVAYVRDLCTCEGKEAIGYAFRDARASNPYDVRFRMFYTA